MMIKYWFITSSLNTFNVQPWLTLYYPCTSGSPTSWIEMGPLQIAFFKGLPRIKTLGRTMLLSKYHRLRLLNIRLWMITNEKMRTTQQRLVWSNLWDVHQRFGELTQSQSWLHNVNMELPQIVGSPSTPNWAKRRSYRWVMMALCLWDHVNSQRENGTHETL